ncbi:unnamed protein product [Discula destructiva]
MTVLRHQQDGSVPSSSKPSLTLDTQAPAISHTNNGGFCVQSAPVGTRHEQGFLPMYQTGDQQVSKLAEMMESPTWRSQNPGPHVRSETLGSRYVQSPFDVEEDTRYKSPQALKENATQGPYKYHDTRQLAPSEIRLSRGSDDIKVHGIHAFPKTPETSANTFIISATVSQQRLLEQIPGLRILEEVTEEEYLSDSNTAAYNAQVLATSRGGAHYDHRESQRNPYPRASSKNDHESKKKRFPDAALEYDQGMDKGRFPVTALTSGQKQDLKLTRKHDGQKAVEHQEADQPINYYQRSSDHQAQATLDEQQRFHSLLNRLHGRDQAQGTMKTAPFIDPAIVAFAPKMAGPGTPTKASTRIRSDSGYISPSVYSGTSSRAQSRLSRVASDRADTETAQTDHRKRASDAFGFDDSPSKNSILNPMAKEFSGHSSASNNSPFKKVAPSHPKVFTPIMQHIQAYSPPFGHPALSIPPQHFQDVLSVPPQPQMGPMQSAEGAWFASQLHQLPNLQNPEAINNHSMMGPMPGMLPQWGNFTGPVIPSSAGVTSMGLNTLSGSMPGLVQPPSHGLAGFDTPPSLPATNMPSPFHQQLSALGLCYNPSHQGLARIAPPAQSCPVPPITVPQTPGAAVAAAAAAAAALPALTPSAVSFIPKNVPKPKIPNTTGQQNWELMHELRRMNEPGYAQKCKEKQKKRYIKQLEQSGGQS